MQKSIRRLTKKTVSVILSMLLAFSCFPLAALAGPDLTPSTVASKFNSNANTNNTFNLAYSLSQRISGYVTVWNGSFSHNGNSYSTGTGNSLTNVQNSIKSAYTGSAGTTAAGWFGSLTGQQYCPSSPYSSNTTDAFGGTTGSAAAPNHAIHSGCDSGTTTADKTVTKTRSVSDALSGDYANDPLSVPTSVVTSVTITLYITGKWHCNHYDSDGGWGHHRHCVEFWYFRAAPGVSTSNSNTNYPLTQVQNLKAALDAANKTQSNYTSSSWSTYSSARTTAQNMWNAIYANPYTAIGTYGSTTIQNAATALNNAIAGLQTTVTLNGNGGTPSASSVAVTVGSGTTGNFPAGSYNASRSDGYTFNGWSTSSSATSGTASGNISVGFNATLYATWTPTNYTITYNTNGGTAIAAKTYNRASTDTLPAASGKAGYSFTTWKPAANSGTWSTGSTYNSGTSLNGKYGNVTLNAQWSPVAYTVTYNANGGSVSPGSLSYNIESTSTLATPTKTGYTFTGWKPQAAAGNWNASTAYAAGASVKNMYGNVTLVAQWQINQYTLTVNPNGGVFNSSSANSTFTQNYQSTKTIDDPTRTGYTFTSWTLSGYGSWNGSNKTYTYGAGAGTLTAGWSANRYTVAFDGNGSTGGSTASITKTYDTAATLTANGFEKTGYTFKGWATSATGEKVYDDGATLSTDLATANGATVTLFAVWEAIPYSVTIDLNSTDPLANYSGETDGIYEQTITLADPTRPGYTFTGWTLVSGSGTLSGSDYTFGPDNATVKANWEAINYTLTLVLNGGEITIDTTQIGIIYDTVEIPDPTREGYIFTGWTKTDGDGTLADGVFTFTADDCQFEAGWEAIPYTLTIDLATEDPTAEYSGTIAESYIFLDTVEIPDPTRTGYDFAGWTITSDKAGTFVDKVYTFSSANVTFTASWTAHPYTIAFDANNDKDISGEMADVDAVFDTAQNLPEIGFEKFGYHFIGWALTPTGEKAYDDQAEVINLTSEKDAVVTLYALWEANPHQMTIEPYVTMELGVEPAMYYNGELAPITFDGIIYDEITLGVPECEGYTFERWAIKEDCETGATLTRLNAYQWTFTFSDDDPELVAVFTPKPFELTVNAIGDTPAEHVNDVTYTGDSSYMKFFTQTVTVPSPVRVGYDFTGWNLTNNAYAPESFTQGFFDGETYTFGSWGQKATATWSPITYNIEIDLNATDKFGNDCSADITYEQGDTDGIIYDVVALGAPTRDGYTFSGWEITEGDGTINADDNTFVFTASDAKIRATWTEIPYTVDIVFTDGSYVAEYSGEPGVTGINHEVVELGTATRRGYDFVRWDLTGKGSIDGSTYTFGDGNATLTAVWEAQRYTINVDLNKQTATYPIETYGDVSYEKSLVYANKIIFDQIDLGNDPERYGFTFKGWTADVGTIEADGRTYTVDNDDATIKANWKINTYKVKFVDVELDKVYENDVTFMDSVEAPEMTEYVPIDADLSYHFLGWTEDGDFAVDSDRIVADVSRDLTFYAIYETVGHVWGEWQYDDFAEHYRICQDCGYKDGHAHRWDSSEITIEPTCYLTGVEVFTCSVCGMQGAVPVEALGHDWSEWTPVPGDEAGCEHGGSEHRFCERCGLEDRKEVMQRFHNLPNSISGEGYCKDCGKFVCTACDQFSALENIPGIGTLYKIIHFFIHTFHQIKYQS